MDALSIQTFARNLTSLWSCCCYRGHCISCSSASGILHRKLKSHQDCLSAGTLSRSWQSCCGLHHSSSKIIARWCVCAQIRIFLDVLDGKLNQSGIDRYDIVSIFVKPKFVCFSQCWCGKILNNESGWQKSWCLSTMYFILTFKI